MVRVLFLVCASHCSIELLVFQIVWALLQGSFSKETEKYLVLFLFYTSHYSIEL